MKYHPWDEISTLSPAWRAAGAWDEPLDGEKKRAGVIFFRRAGRVGRTGRNDPVVPAMEQPDRVRSSVAVQEAGTQRRLLDR